MSHNEAVGLLAIVEDESYTLCPRLRQIGNGEYVVIINWGHHSYFLWSRDDYFALKHSMYKYETHHIYPHEHYERIIVI